MKKQLLLGALSLTAGMAANASFLEVPLAKSTRIEKAFAEAFLLKVSTPARFTKQDGTTTLGHVYLKLDQNPLTPAYTNLLHWEMIGALYFKSDDNSTTWYPLAGDDGEVLLDLVGSKHGDRVYQVYGCNSTMNICSGENIQVAFNGSNVDITMSLAERTEVEFLVDFVTGSDDGKLIKTQEWVREIYAAEMNEAPLEN